MPTAHRNIIYSVINFRRKNHKSARRVHIMYNQSFIGLQSAPLAPVGCEIAPYPSGPLTARLCWQHCKPYLAEESERFKIVLFLKFCVLLPWLQFSHGLD